MRLRYYADSSFEDDHEAVLERLRAIEAEWGIPVGVLRVRDRHGAIDAFPGEVREGDLEEVFEREFEYNPYLSVTTDRDPVDAFTTKSGLVTIAGCVGVVDQELQWATVLSGRPPDGDGRMADTYSISFLDDVLERGPEALEERLSGDDDRSTDVVGELLGCEHFDDGGVLGIQRSVTVGDTVALDGGVTVGANHDVQDLTTRSVDAVVEADQTWIVTVEDEFTADSFDRALGRVCVADSLYRADADRPRNETRRAVVFRSAPENLGSPEFSITITPLVEHARARNVEVFVHHGDGSPSESGEFACLTAKSELFPDS